MQRLALYGLQLFGNALDVIVNQDRRLIDGEFLTHGELSETAVIGNEMCQILRTRLHGEHHGAVHQGDILPTDDR